MINVSRQRQRSARSPGVRPVGVIDRPRGVLVVAAALAAVAVAVAVARPGLIPLDAVTGAAVGAVSWVSALLLVALAGRFRRRRRGPVAPATDGESPRDARALGPTQSRPSGRPTVDGPAPGEVRSRDLWTGGADAAPDEHEPFGGLRAEEVWSRDEERRAGNGPVSPVPVRAGRADRGG